MTRINSDNLFGVTQYIVDISPAFGSFVSIQAAINQAVADGHTAVNPATVFIRAGEYVENVTMASGISLVGFTGSTLQAPFFDPNFTSQTSIKGQLIANYSGLAAITGITFTSNGTVPLLISAGPGPLPMVLEAWDCSFYSEATVCISVTASNGNFTARNCRIQQEGANGYFDVSSPTEVGFVDCVFNSLSNVSLSSTMSDGNVVFEYCNSDAGIDCSGIGTFSAAYSSIFSSTSTVINHTSASDMELKYCDISSTFIGASAIDIALGSTIRMISCSVRGGATPEINGFGSLFYDHLFGVNTLAATLTVTTFTTLPIAGTALASRGHAYFAPLDFTVSATGEVFSNHNDTWLDQVGSTTVPVNTGNFITGPGVTLTLPAIPAQGDICEFCVIGANTPAIIAANGAQKIQIGATLSIAGGTATNTASGDSLRLVFRFVDQIWYAVPGIEGIWTVI